MQDQILRIVQLSEQLWNERKGLDWIRKGERKRQIVRIEKLVKEIQSIDVNTEISFLKKLYQIE